MKARIDKKEYSRPVVSFLVLAGLVGGYAGLWLFLEEMRSEVQNKQQLLYSITNEETSGRSGTDVLRRTETERSQIGDHLVQRDNFVNIIEQIEMIALASDVELLKQLREQDDQVFFQLTVKGSFDGVMYFLRLIETMPYRVEVRRAHSEQIRSAAERALSEWRGNFDVVLYAHNLNL